MTMKGSLLAVTTVAIALVLSGCDDMSGTDDVSTALPHHGTWYFADPDPDDDVPLPPDTRLVLTAREFTLAMGDDMGTTFMLFQTPDVTRFEVTGTYMIGAAGNTSFEFPDELESAVIVEPDALQSVIAPRVVAAAAVIREDGTATLMVDPENLSRVTISGFFLPGLLNLPGVMEVTACKGAPCTE